MDVRVVGRGPLPWDSREGGVRDRPRGLCYLPGIDTKSETEVMSPTFLNPLSALERFGAQGVDSLPLDHGYISRTVYLSDSVIVDNRRNKLHWRNDVRYTSQKIPY